ncbi:MAG TPA: peptide chain release factor 1 [Candidatus Egerieicola faecale]|uniref:Peptide chain release factor 1 n=1 Tax=Candidatus Egerieicola faecale TaxID=2840774 RepID=A0A9D1IUA4_9FIRM|nr:peptide chain release factor 1 [Candidatus Egerieicola faecale]
MFEQMQMVQKRYQELTRLLADPAVLADGARYTQVNREWKSLSPLMDAYQSYRSAQLSLEETRQLLQEPDLDPELAALAKEELAAWQEQSETLAQQLQLLLLPKDPLDGKNVILEIRAGAGGEEAALFAHSLLRMYTMYAARRNWKTELISQNATELGGVKEAALSLEGEDIYSRLKFESGVHRVQRVPETETGGRIHTSTVTVAVLPQADEVEVEIDPKDLQIDTFRSSGAGGQHINKTESAIRITHLPTGLVVECQDERSQYKNKDKAMRVLRSRLYQRQLEKQNQEIADNRKAQVGTGDRSERIRTYNFPQGRCTDHRIGLTLYRLDSILDGDLDELIDPLIADYQAKLLAQQQPL